MDVQNDAAIAALFLRPLTVRPSALRPPSLLLREPAAAAGRVFADVNAACAAAVRRAATPCLPHEQYNIWEGTVLYSNTAEGYAFYILLYSLVGFPQ